MDESTDIALGKMVRGAWRVFLCMMPAGKKWIQSRIMVCSYCKSDEPRPHNVRTCKYLQAAIAVFMSYKGAKMTMDSFLEGCVAFAADLVFTGGMATVATGLYEAYTKCCDSIDIGGFLLKSKREQAKELLKTGHFGHNVKENADAYAGEMSDGL
jgi:hypothetical protein